MPVCGGTVIEVRFATLLGDGLPHGGIPVLRLWTINRNEDMEEEVGLYCARCARPPMVGEEITWTSGWVTYHAGRLRKYGPQFTPKETREPHGQSPR
jgi:hypothetical protein